MKCAVVSKGLPTTNIRTTNLVREKSKSTMGTHNKLDPSQNNLQLQSHQQLQLQN